EEAIEKYKKATELNPEYADAYINWGISLAGLGKREEAIEKYKKATELNPEYALAYSNWGISLAGLGRHEEAIEKYQKAIELNPEYVEAYSNWGLSLYSLGKHEEAIEKYKKASKLAPDNPSIWGQIGWYYYANMKNYPKSIEVSQKALEIDEKAAWIRCNLAIALLHNNQYEEAKKEYKNTIQLIRAVEYSDMEYGKNRKRLLQEYGLEDLYDAKKVASGKLLDHINEII
ncbi:hypothetical protein LCGC14_1470380, partial [marine sediment metagenome]